MVCSVGVLPLPHISEDGGELVRVTAGAGAGFFALCMVAAEATVVPAPNTQSATTVATRVLLFM